VTPSGPILSFKIDDVYCRLIPLTQGQYTIVDAADYEWLTQWKWHARWNITCRCFYASRMAVLDGKRIQVNMHREIMGLSYKDPRTVDHKYILATTDNRRSNLRYATRKEQNAHRGKRSDNKSGYKGVSWRKRQRKWVAQVGGKHLGYFVSLEDAYAAYCKSAVEEFGEFASLT
jgi:hypothetical protein